MENTNLLTPKDVASRLGLKVPTVWGWIRKGALKGNKPTGTNRIFIDESELKAFLSGRKKHKSAR